MGGLEASISKAIFGRQDRMSNADFQHYQNLADSGNPREIARQGAFLEGIAPSQAAAHNQFQDATYAQDTQRATDRITQMGQDLGMSNWEIMGQSGSTPLPTPAAPQNNNGAFLSGMVPIKTAEIQAETQLKSTALNNLTQLEIAKLQSDTTRYGTDVGAETSRTVAMLQTANGQVPISQVEMNAAQQLKMLDERDLIRTQDQAARNEMYVRSVLALAQLAGKTSIDMGFYKRDTVNGAKELSEILRMSHMSPLEIEDYIRKMPYDEWAGLEQDLDEIVNMVLSASGKMAGGIGSGIGNFLQDLVGSRPNKPASISQRATPRRP